MLRRRSITVVTIITAVALVASVFNILGSIRMSRVLDDVLVKSCGMQPHQTMAILPRVDESVDYDFPEDERDRRRLWTVTSKSGNHLDVGVLIFGQEEKLLSFAKAYGDAIQSFRTSVTSVHHEPMGFRLLLTRYPSDDSSLEFRQKLAMASSLPTEDIVFVVSENPEFNRAQARNLLHTHAKQMKQAVLAVVDVDMWIGPRFLFNALKKVRSDKVYFPVVYSDFRPSSVLLVERFLGPQKRYSEHRGLWRGTSDA
jgi:Chondroitin N-acetylgalactosaminyltransferase